jgi:thioredoxin 1
MKKVFTAIVFIGAVFTLMFIYTDQQQKQDQAFRESLPEVPAPGLVTMVNMGSDSCMPCKMMQPFLDELKVEYEDQAKIAFIDVWKHTDYGRKFEIMTIPTQIFFDHQGMETFRHQGYLDKNSIVTILEELLEKQKTAAISHSPGKT